MSEIAASAEGLPTIESRDAGTLDLARYWTLTLDEDPTFEPGRIRQRLLIKALAEFAAELDALRAENQRLRDEMASHGKGVGYEP